MIDVFAVGIRLSVEGNSQQFLASMLSQLTGIEVAAGKVGSQLSKMRTLAIGVGQVMIGGAMITGMDALLKKGIAFNQELAKMKMANYAPGDISMLEKQAYVTMQKVPGTNLVDALKTNVDLRNVSGLAEHAVALSTTISKVNGVLANISGKPAEEAGFKFIKFLEDAGRMMGPDGKFNEDRVMLQSRWMEAVIAATNGRVTGDSEFQFRQSGKAAVNALSDIGLTNLQPLIMSLGASQTGTGLQGIGTQLLGATQLYGHTVAWLEGHGMLDPNKVHRQKGGRYSLDKGAITGSDELNSDPAGWIWNVLSKHLQGKDGKEMSIADKVADLRSSGMLRTSLGLIVEAIQNEVTQKKEVENINRAGGVDQFDVMNKESPTFRITKFTEAWANLQIALGKTVDVTQFLVPLTDALNKLNAMAVAHPEVAKDLIEVTAALGGLIALSGGLKVLGIALGPLASGLKLLVGVGGDIAVVGTGLTAVGTGISSLITPVTAIMALLKFGSDHDKGVGTPDPLSDLNRLRQKGVGRGIPEPNDGFGPGGQPTSVAPGKQSMADPVYVHVVSGQLALNNPGDIGRHISGGLSDGISRPQSGPSYEDYRQDLPSPGFALG